MTNIEKSDLLISIDKTWTLFLDRDGVINQRIPDSYVTAPADFVWMEGSLEALQKLTGRFLRIVVVTNQQGIGKGLMTVEELEKVHASMLQDVQNAGARIDNVYFCPGLAVENPACRKPNTGMALQAKIDFPEIDFEKSIMVGDSLTDILFGNRLEMTTVFIESNPEEVIKVKSKGIINFRFSNLLKFANLCMKLKTD